MSEKTKMMDYSSSPIKLPEELRALLEQSNTDESGCAECYSTPPQWANLNPNMPELIIQDPSENLQGENTAIPENKYNFQEKNKEEHFWKFNEGKTLKAAEEYIKSTYHQHYTSEESKVQVLDIIEAIGDGVPFCRDNLIKYSARFGKKNGFSKLDALKIIHYGILMYNFAGFHKNVNDRYETF
jgi:hypothetical protein